GADIQFQGAILIEVGGGGGHAQRVALAQAYRLVAVAEGIVLQIGARRKRRALAAKVAVKAHRGAGIHRQQVGLAILVEVGHRGAQVGEP
nr:hypothetical protein [Tanacetum cinerariifolium]